MMGLHPLHFMQVDAPIGSAESRACIEPIFQYNWQNADAVAREELAEVMLEAEEDLSDVLGYYPISKWSADIRVELDLPYRAGTWPASMYDIRGDHINVKLPRGGHAISGGRVAKTEIIAGTAVTYTDADSDGYEETATVGPIATTVTDEEEICLYYPGESGDDAWEIRPISVTISGGMVTIVARREQFVAKVLLESLDAQSVNGVGVPTNFLAEVDVYRKYNDPSVQVEFVWRGSGGCSCGGDATCVQCGLAIQTGCMTVKDKELGIVTLSYGAWDADAQVYDPAMPSVCRRPDYVRLWYRSGYRNMSYYLPNIKMDHAFERAIAKLAVSKVTRPICSCKAIADIQARWNTDLRRSVSTGAQATAFRVTNYELESNPFGSSVGAFDVWRLVRRRTLGLIGDV